MEKRIRRRIIEIVVVIAIASTRIPFLHMDILVLSKSSISSKIDLIFFNFSAIATAIVFQFYNGPF